MFVLLIAVLGAFLLWPIALTVMGGFVDSEGNPTLRYIYDTQAGESASGGAGAEADVGIGVLQDPLYQAGLKNATLIAVCTTVLCIFITIPLAVLSTRFDFPGKALLTAMVMAPLILPPFVGAIGLRALMGRSGALNQLLMNVGLLDPAAGGIDFLGGEGLGGRFAGIVIAEALHLYPILYLNVAASMANLDPALDEAAVGLGAGRWRRFFKVTLPLIMPGIFAGGTIVFIWSFTELGTPLMFNFYEVTPVQVFWGLQEIESNPRPYALVVVMLAVAIAMYLMGKFAFGRRAYAMQAKASVGATSTKLRGARGWLASGAFAGVIAIAMLPHLGVVLISLSQPGGWYQSVLPEELTGSHFANALRHDLAMGSIQNSLIYASGAMVLCIVLGLAISYLTVRVKVRGGWLLDSLAMLPLAVPGLVMAFGYWAMTMHWPFPQLAAMFKGWGWDEASRLMQLKGSTPNPLLFLVIAYGVRRLPYVVRSASAGLEQTSGQLEEAALNLGASQGTTLRRIVIPLIMANLIAGGILAFSFAMLEVSDSLILAQKQTHYPITKAIYELYNRLGDGQHIASAMGVWAMALLLVTLVGAGLLMGKRMGALFRV